MMIELFLMFLIKFINWILFLILDKFLLLNIDSYNKKWSISILRFSGYEICFFFGSEWLVMMSKLVVLLVFYF